LKTVQKALCIDSTREHYFSIRTLYNFRLRLTEYIEKTGTGPIINVFKEGRDRIIDKLEIKTGLQRTVSVMIAGNIKRMSRLMLFHKVLTNLVKIIKKNYKVKLGVLKYSKEDDCMQSCRLPADEVNSTTKTIAVLLRGLVTHYKKNNRINKTDAYKKAVRLLNEQVIVEGKSRLPDIRLKEPKDISSGSMQNPADEDATYRKKRDEKHYGYSAHAVETCNKENPIQVITQVDLV